MGEAPQVAEMARVDGEHGDASPATAHPKAEVMEVDGVVDELWDQDVTIDLHENENSGEMPDSGVLNEDIPPPPPPPEAGTEGNEDA